MAGDSIPHTEKQALAEAWRAADYRVRVADLVLRLQVDAPAPRLERHLPGWSYTLVSAWNPPPGPLPLARNRAAAALLAGRVQRCQPAAVPAEASDGFGQWVEPGWLLRNLALEQALALAQRFGQGGILYWRRGQPVGLRLLWSSDLAAKARG